MDYKPRDSGPHGADIRIPNTEFDPKVDHIVGLARAMEEGGIHHRAANAMRHVFPREVATGMSVLDAMVAARFNQRGEELTRDFVERVVEEDSIARISMKTPDGEYDAAATEQKKAEHRASVRAWLDAVYAVPADDMRGFFAEGKGRAERRYLAARVRPAFAGRQFANVQAIETLAANINSNFFKLSEEEIRRARRETIDTEVGELVAAFPSPLFPGKQARVLLRPTGGGEKYYLMVG